MRVFCGWSVSCDRCQSACNRVTAASKSTYVRTGGVETQAQDSTTTVARPSNRAVVGADVHSSSIFVATKPSDGSFESVAGGD